MITKFVLNSVLHYVGLSCIVSPNKQLKYDIKENNHPYWINKFPQYNTSICFKFCENVFGGFIRNYGTDRCNIMCYINVHNKVQPTYFDDASSGGGREIPKNATTVELESLGATLNFIDCWLKLFHNNYKVRSKMCNEAIQKLLKQIPTMKSKPLIHDKIHQLLLIDICGTQYLTHLVA